MSVPATAKPGRGPRRLGADLPGHGPRRVDRTRRRHMVLLPEYAEGADSDGADGGDATARGNGGAGGDVGAVRRSGWGPESSGLAARLPIRAIPTAPARVTARPAAGRGSTEPMRPVRTAASERAVGVHAMEAIALLAPASSAESARTNGGVAASPRIERVAAPDRAGRSARLGGEAPRVHPAAQARPGGRARAERGWSFAGLPRRGQRLLVGVGFALAIGLGTLAGNVLGLGGEVPAGTAVVTVEPGESLWQIASASVEPGTDLRPVIDHIRELNRLDGSTVVDGQRLLVPASEN